MALTVGIVGMPNVGKSTLFNAITNSQVEAANYPFATIQPNTGTVEVPDFRLDELCKIFKPQKRIAATIEFTDIAGLVKGASQGAGLGNQFLANIRETDAICHVVRCFENNEIIHVDGSIDAFRDAETINLELIFADIDTLTKKLQRIEKRAVLGKEKEIKAEYDALKPVLDTLEKGLPARIIEITKDNKEYIKSCHLLTSKPMIYVANLGEKDLTAPEDNNQYQALKRLAIKEKAEIIAICAQAEADISLLENEEKELFMQEYGIKEAGLEKLIKASYHLLGLETFLTGGDKECRAWTFKKGMSAPQCAGVIHSDFERGFIKAEIYTFNDLMIYKSEQAIKEAGKYRIEGKDYIMKDGDVVFFRFNV